MRVLTTPFNGRTLTFSCISLICWILLGRKTRSSDAEVLKSSKPNICPQHFAVFLQFFVGRWMPIHLRFIPLPFNIPKGFSYLEHHVRCFSVQAFDESHPQQGLVCHRESGYFPALGGTSNRCFTERRVSVIFQNFKSQPFLPLFKILILSDVKIDEFEWASFEMPDQDTLTVRGWRAGLQVFQLALQGIILTWEKQWKSCLDEVENCVRIQVSHIPISSRSRTYYCH